MGRWYPQMLNQQGFASLLSALNGRARHTSEGKIEVPIRSFYMNVAQDTPSYRKFLFIDTPVFNLQTLMLRNMATSEKRFLDIAEVLSNSPQLKYLSISSANPTKHCLEELCDCFTAFGAPQLRLVSLNLGTGFEPIWPRRIPAGVSPRYKAVATYLQKLTNLECLTDLAFSFYSGNFASFALGTFSPEVLARLRYFALIANYSPQDLDHLNQYLDKALGKRKAQRLRQQIVITFQSSSLWNYQNSAKELKGLICLTPLPTTSSRLSENEGPIRLPRMRVCLIPIWWPHLVHSCENYFTAMHALEGLCISTYQPSNIRVKLRVTQTVLGILSDAAHRVANRCSALRYVKIEVRAECTNDGQAICRSWKVTRKWSDKEGRTVVCIQELDKDGDEEWCPEDLLSRKQRAIKLLSTRG